MVRRVCLGAETVRASGDIVNLHEKLYKRLAKVPKSAENENIKKKRLQIERDYHAGGADI